jgi:hypothetical protein
MKKQKLEALEREMKLEEDKLIAQMEYARFVTLRFTVADRNSILHMMLILKTGEFFFKSVRM